MGGGTYDVTFAYTLSPAPQVLSRTISNANFRWAQGSSGYDGYVADGLDRYATVDGVGFTYDGRGNLTDDDVLAYGYDAYNRMTSADTADYQFDPAGRLFKEDGAAVRKFIYAGGQMAGEYTNAGSMTRRYIPGPGIDELAGWQAPSVTPVTRYAPTTDERGSVIANTSSTGGIVGAINTYDEYGIPASGNYGRFQYTGQPWLVDAGLYHYRARAYAAPLGRFMKPDPIGYAGGQNLYAYVGGDPMNRVDPSGLEPGGGECVPTDRGGDCIDPVPVWGVAGCKASMFGTCVNNPKGPGIWHPKDGFERVGQDGGPGFDKNRDGRPLPPGYQPYVGTAGDDGKMMVAPDGTLHLTPGYRDYINDPANQIDYDGVMNDLLKIIGDSYAGAAEFGLRTIIGGAIALYGRWRDGERE